MPTVAEVLEEAMRRKNMTQQRLAKETGITAPWINMIIRRGKAPGSSALLRIAEVLGIDKRRLVRQAHFERAYDEWKPYLEHGEEEPAQRQAIQLMPRRPDVVDPPAGPKPIGSGVGPTGPESAAARLTGVVPVVGRSLPEREGASEVETLPRSGRPGRCGRVRPASGAARSNGTDETADAPGTYRAASDRPEDAASSGRRRRSDRARQRGRGPMKGGAFVGFDPECKAIRVEGDGLEPVAYDGQYVVVSPRIPKDRVPDGAIVYVTYELAGDTEPRAMIRRMYRYRLPGEDDGKGGRSGRAASGPPDDARRRGLPIYNFVPVNTRLRMKGHEPEPEGAITLRHRSVREMYPVVGVIFGPPGRTPLEQGTADEGG